MPPVQVDASHPLVFYRLLSPLPACTTTPVPSQLNRDDVSFFDGSSKHGCVGCATSVAQLQHPMKSLILAQDERWRRA
jgi:hypothetical protein